MNFRIIVPILFLLLQTAWAETPLIPNLTLTDLNGKSHNLRAQEHQILFLAKPGKKSRRQNMEWMQALAKEFREKESRIWLVADLSSRPRFASKDMVKKKLNSRAEPRSKEFMLLDWDGKLRKAMNLDSQQHVYLLGPGGSILAHTTGLYRKGKLDELVRTSKSP